jgi:hypothetical protein
MTLTFLKKWWVDQMCDVQEDMGKHLVPLTSIDEGHKIEYKHKSDSVTTT